MNEVDADSKSVQFSVEIVDKSGLPEDVARIVGTSRSMTSAHTLMAGR